MRRVAPHVAEDDLLRRAEELGIGGRAQIDAPPADILARPDLHTNGRMLDVACTTDAIINSAQAPWRDLISLSGADQRTRSLALALSAELVAPGGADFLSQPVARVVWGAGGTPLYLELDVGPRGQALVLHASELQVQVAASGQGTCRFRAHVGGAHASQTMPPTRTRVASSLAPLAATTFAVPPFAVEAIVQRTPDLMPYRWQCVRQSGLAVASGLVAPGAGESRFRLPPDTDHVTLTNMGFLALATMRVMFVLEVA